MTRIFLDANVLVAVLCNEYPKFTACARVLSLADDRRFKVFTSPLCIAIAAYFASKKNGRKLAKKKIALLMEKLEITTVDDQCCRNAINEKRIEDLEDGFEYFSAIGSKCGFIVTYDKSDFHFSQIPVMEPERFLLDHVIGKRAKGRDASRSQRRERSKGV